MESKIHPLSICLFLMRKMTLFFVVLVAPIVYNALLAQAQNPIIFADVPDMAIAHVDDTYYMSSTPPA